MILGDLGLGGAQAVAARLVAGLYARGWMMEVVAVAPRSGASPTHLPEKVVLRNLGARRSRAALPALWQMVGASPRIPLIIFGHEIGALLAPMVALRRGRPALIVRCLNHLSAELAGGGWGMRAKRLALRLLLPRCERVVAQSEAMARELRQRWGVPRQRITVVPNPLPPWAAVSGPRSAARWDLAWIGRFEPQKDPLWLVATLAELAKRGRRPSVVMVGTGSLEAEVATVVAAAGLSDQVELTGYRSDVAAVLAATRAVVLTSRFEGFPNVLLEALAMGVPVVAADCPHGPAELIEQGRNGVLVGERSDEALADGIESVLDQPWDPEVLRASVAAHEPEAVMDAWEALLASSGCGPRSVQRSSGGEY